MPLEIYKGKGRKLRRVDFSRQGDVFFRLLSGWLRSGGFVAR